MDLMRVSLLAALSVCIGCGGDSVDDGGVIQLESGDMETGQTDSNLIDAMAVSDAAVGSADAASGTTIEATVRVINPATGQGYSGVTVIGADGEALTDGTGRATVPVSPGLYQIRLEGPGARPHTVWGVAADASFEQVTYMSPEMITAYVFGALGLMDDPTKGILVVGLDLPSLAPAIGASATVNLEHGLPFVFAGNQPAAGSVIPMGGQGFVTFPNVNPGEVSIATDYPNGGCQIFPAETGDRSVEILAGEVTVVAFTCRPTP